jgi:hypothetical protein
MQELIYKWREENQANGHGSRRAALGLTKFVRELDHNYRSFEDFLLDNPGVVEAIYDWVAESASQEWEDNLRDLLPDKDDEY